MSAPTWVLVARLERILETVHIKLTAGDEAGGMAALEQARDLASEVLDAVS